MQTFGYPDLYAANRGRTLQRQSRAEKKLCRPIQLSSIQNLSSGLCSRDYSWFGRSALMVTLLTAKLSMVCVPVLMGPIAVSVILWWLELWFQFCGDCPWPLLKVEILSAPLLHPCLECSHLWRYALAYFKGYELGDKAVGVPCRTYSDRRFVRQSVSLVVWLSGQLLQLLGLCNDFIRAENADGEAFLSCKKRLTAFIQGLNSWLYHSLLVADG